MNRYAQGWCWRLALENLLVVGGAFGAAVSQTLALSANCVFAQMTPDETLENNSIVTPDGSTLNIKGGTQAGSNLFHSFKEFSVPTGGTAFFYNAADIQNIISRVTGGSVSKIDGIIRANGTANLFLINPNGIIFGRDASLNIGGSFVASTASSLKFSDGKEFSAKTPQTTPLLSVNVPLGLQYGANSGSILNQSQARNSSREPVGLQVKSGKTLALVGGEVVLEGGRLTAPGGRIELGSVAGLGLVSLNPTDNGWALGYEGVQNFQDIKLSQQAVVDASNKGGGGDIQVQGRRVTVTDGSQIATKTLGAETGGTLTVHASEEVVVSGESTNPQDFSRLTTRTEGAGNAGALTITTGKLAIRNGAQVSTGTLSTGTGGSLTVNASDLVEVSGESKDGEVLSRLTTRTEGGGNAGNLTITTGKLMIQAGGQVSAGTLEQTTGAGGTLTVNASEEVVVSGESTNSRDFSRLTTRTQGTGNAGNLTITTGKLMIQAGGQVSTGTLLGSTGQGGTLTVNASEEVQVSGASADGEVLSRLTTRTQNTGDAGDLTITTRKLVVENGAQVSAGTDSGTSTGDGGTLSVHASEEVRISGPSPNDGDVSRLTARTEGAGDAKVLTITTGKLVIENGAQVSAGTSGEGQGGNFDCDRKGLSGSEWVRSPTNR
ncbi:MAG: filamentous hemagglutinin N-terminal domain-containing protein [Scytonema sp. CRU_2_7]|nr:filamentous hemagglutinin N-terminal domain-containing protein [Scytonema sp. CRU_2_7]